MCGYWLLNRKTRKEWIKFSAQYSKIATTTTKKNNTYRRLKLDRQETGVIQMRGQERAKA